MVIPTYINNIKFTKIFIFFKVIGFLPVTENLSKAVP